MTGTIEVTGGYRVVPAMFDQERLDAWLDDLRTTDAPQGRDFLANDGAYCCLGRLALVGGRVPVEVDEILCSRQDIAWLLDTEAHELPSEVDGVHFEIGDVVLDIPKQYDIRDRDYMTENPNILGSSLNDGWRLTFSQIADMISYFGLRGYYVTD